MLKSTISSNVRDAYSPTLHFIISFAKEIQISDKFVFRKVHPVAWIDSWLCILETLVLQKMVVDRFDGLI